MKTSALLLLLFFATLPSSFAAPDINKEAPDDPNRFSYESRLIFYAVLEGLYESGVESDDLERIIPSPEKMLLEDNPDGMNFVYACPICSPAFDACALYHCRRPFQLQKGSHYNTFGQGLDAKTKKQLRASPAERRAAIRDLIETWISARLDGLAITKERRTEIEGNLAEMRKDGTAALKSFQGLDPEKDLAKLYKDWSSCAFCDGACMITPEE